ncbi:hypothetical protein JCM10213_007462 [Rhodosporidiobolus nylandii]
MPASPPPAAGSPPPAASTDGPAAAEGADAPATLSVKGTAGAEKENGDAEIRDATPPPAAPAGEEDKVEQSPAADGGAAVKRSAEEIEQDEEQRKKEDEEKAAKKRKLEEAREQHKKESKQRGNRMFGVMLGTLQRAKKQVSSANTTEAGKKRAEIEEKLQEKLHKERRDAAEKEGREREAKELKLEILRREEEVAVGDSIFRTRHNAKLDLAGFLCTTFTLPPSATSNIPTGPSDDIPPAFLPKLPHAMSLHDPRAPRPIYYLPRRLLPSQEDRIEDQIDAVKKEMRKERDEWEERKKGKLDKLEQARRKRDERFEDIERAEREERQRRRREEEDREDRERERARRERISTREPSVAGMAVDRDEARGRSVSAAPAPAKEGDDVPMREGSAAPANGGQTAIAGEDELEY